MQCEMEVFKVMEAENLAAAKVPKRVAFSYIDLTAKTVLPLWLPADVIGGAAAFSADLTNSDTGSLAAIGRALQAATSQKKIFRTHAQWLGCFTKYSVAAVAAKQMTFANVLTYLNTLSRLQEAETSKKFYVMVLYDDALRRSLARRAEARVPGLDLSAEFGVIDKQILEACRGRVDAVMSAHGLRDGTTSNATSSSVAGILRSSPVPFPGTRPGNNDADVQALARQRLTKLRLGLQRHRRLWSVQLVSSRTSTTARAMPRIERENGLCRN